MTWWASSSEQPNILVDGGTVLDSRMVNSCTYFKDEDESQDNAHFAKSGISAANSACGAARLCLTWDVAREAWLLTRSRNTERFRPAAL